MKGLPVVFLLKLSNEFDLKYSLYFTISIQSWSEVQPMAHSVWVWRKALEMAQTALGDLIKVTRQTINTIENAKDDPSLALAFRWARTLAMADLFQD